MAAHDITTTVLARRLQRAMAPDCPAATVLIDVAHDATGWCVRIDKRPAMRTVLFTAAISLAGLAGPEPTLTSTSHKRHSRGLVPA